MSIFDKLNPMQIVIAIAQQHLQTPEAKQAFVDMVMNARDAAKAMKIYAENQNRIEAKLDELLSRDHPAPANNSGRRSELIMNGEKHHG